MKRKIIILLSIIILYNIVTYVYHQYQKFEQFFMEAKLYGSGKIFLDSTFDKTNKPNNVKDYTYTFFLENKNNKNVSKTFYITTSFMNNKIIGGGGGSDIDNILKYYDIRHVTYMKQIYNKQVVSNNPAYYLIIEYEKKRQIRYYVEITKKIEKNMFTIYFKSYPPKMILNAKNQYIKD